MAITKLIADSITSGAIASTPAFEAYLDNGTTPSNDVTTLVTFDVEKFDTDQNALVGKIEEIYGFNYVP